MDEEFHALSNKDDDRVNQTSWIEPVCKKAQTSAGTLYTDGNWCEEDKKRAIIIQSDCEMKSYKFQQHSSFFFVVFYLGICGKNTAQTNAYAKLKIANKTLCQFSVLHEWYDVEEEMWEFWIWVSAWELFIYLI